jgi:hypothetical protein
MVADAHKRTPKESEAWDQRMSCFCWQGTFNNLPSSAKNSMAACAHEQAAGSFRAKAIFGRRWERAVDTLLNTALEGMRGVFRAARSRDRLERNADLSNYEAAQIAKQEWLSAVEYFNEVSEPDLVDYAVYSLHAAERKYMYLLDKAREDYASLV